MEQSKNKPKLWQIFLAIALLVIAWVLPGDGGANLRGEDLAPVAILTGVIFLVKIGFFSLIVLGIKTLIDWIRNKKR